MRPDSPFKKEREWYQNAGVGMMTLGAVAGAGGMVAMTAAAPEIATVLLLGGAVSVLVGGISYAQGSAVIDYENPIEIIAVREEAAGMKYEDVISKHRYDRVFQYGILSPELFTAKFNLWARGRSFSDILREIDRLKLEHTSVAKSTGTRFSFVLPRADDWVGYFYREMRTIRPEHFVHSYDLDLLHRYDVLNGIAYRELSDFSEDYRGVEGNQKREIKAVSGEYLSRIERRRAERDEQIANLNDAHEHRYEVVELARRKQIQEMASADRESAVRDARRAFDQNKDVIRLGRIDAEFEEKLALGLRDIAERRRVEEERHQTYLQSVLSGVRERSDLKGEQIKGFDAEMDRHNKVMSELTAERKELASASEKQKQSVKGELEKRVEQLRKERDLVIADMISPSIRRTDIPGLGIERLELQVHGLKQHLNRDIALCRDRCASDVARLESEMQVRVAEIKERYRPQLRELGYRFTEVLRRNELIPQ